MPSGLATANTVVLFTHQLDQCPTIRRLLYLSLVLFFKHYVPIPSVESGSHTSEHSAYVRCVAIDVGQRQIVTYARGRFFIFLPLDAICGQDGRYTHL